MNTTKHGPVEPEDLRRLPTSECAIMLLRTLARGASVNSVGAFQAAKDAYDSSGEPDIDFLLERLSDAWAWLEAHGLLGPSPRDDGGSQKRLTARGRELAQNPDAVAAVLADERLAMRLHPGLESKVRPIFGLPDYETAAFCAFKEIEVRVRGLAGAAEALVGVPLMRTSFKPDGGPLADSDADGGERVVTMELFAGAMGTFKNPASHRTIAYDDPTEAAEVVLLADLLMRLLDRVQDRLAEVNAASPPAPNDAITFGGLTEQAAF